METSDQDWFVCLIMIECRYEEILSERKEIVIERDGMDVAWRNEATEEFSAVEGNLELV
nr:hypothetical protein [uncultured Faecalimonas sp.]